MSATGLNKRQLSMSNLSNYQPSIKQSTTFKSSINVNMVGDEIEKLSIPDDY